MAMDLWYLIAEKSLLALEHVILSQLMSIFTPLFRPNEWPKTGEGVIFEQKAA